jgi:glutathione peroxidase-family protein
MFKYIVILTMLFFVVAFGGEKQKNNNAGDNMQANKMKTGTDIDLMNIPFKTITGDSASLSDYKGKVILVVNVASKCGFTPQYAGLEELYKKYEDKGFVILGFPENNFKNQEPGTNEEILKFCQSKYGVTFPMMSKISVKGKDIHPLYVALTEKSKFPGDITWNFNKFLLDRKGNVVGRFDSPVEPMSDELVGAIKKLL